jgi:hypothetical protein
VDFSPRSVRLAKAGRTAVRVFIATSEDHGGFPHHHIDLTWEALERLAKEPWAEKDWEEVVADALKNNIRKRNLIGYVTPVFCPTSLSHTKVNSSHGQEQHR